MLGDDLLLDPANFTDHRIRYPFGCRIGINCLHVDQGNIPGEKGEIVGGSRFFAGKSAWIRRVEGLEGGDGRISTTEGTENTECLVKNP